ncbi:ABC transporter permease [candidate division KSB1 bacterium]
MKNHNPPRFCKWLLQRTVRYENRRLVTGDFEEAFNAIVVENGIFQARWWYRWQVLKSMPSNNLNTIIWSIIMLKNYWIITFRNLLRNRTYSAINLFGLSIGIACCILALLYIEDERSYDQFHENKDRIFRVAHYLKTDTGKISKQPWCFPNEAQMIKSMFPDIEKTVRIDRNGGLVFTEPGERFLVDIWYADPTFFEVFSFDLLAGDPETVLSGINTTVVTEDFALKYFGTTDVLGKTVNLENKYTYTVSGIAQSVPNNSYLKFEMLVSFPSQEARIGERQYKMNLVYTYLLMNKAIAPASFKEKLTEYSIARYGEKRAAGRDYFLQPLPSLHHNTEFSLGLGSANDKKFMYYYSLIAFSILLIACLNFMNISTSRAFRRAREVGIRKISGAGKMQLLRQFIGESVLLSFLSFIGALIITAFTLPLFNDFVRKDLSLLPGYSQTVLGSVPLIVLFVGIIAGIYPAIILSSFRPVDVIKSFGRKGSKGAFIRKTFVVFQFAVSLIFIIGTIVIVRQISFMRTADLGFSDDNIITVSSYWLVRSEQDLERVRGELLSNPDIIDVVGFQVTPGLYPGFESPFRPEGFSEDAHVVLNMNSVGYGFFDFFDLELVQGREFSREFGGDVENALIVNESTIKEIGWKEPIGKFLSYDSEEISGKIIGVVKDYHQASLHEPIRPMVFSLDHRFYSYVAVKTIPGKTEDVMKYLEKKWIELSPEKNFHASYLSENLDNLYREDTRTRQIFSASAVVAVVLAGLGLFGLALFTAENRTKEIGVRKVLGASISSIMGLLNKEFLILIILANVLSWPAAYYVMQRWLQNFAYKDSLDLEIFLFSFILIIAIAFLTVGIQTIRAARTNPIDSLRYE